MCLMTYQRNHHKIQLARAESGACRERLHRAARLATGSAAVGRGMMYGGGSSSSSSSSSSNSSSSGSGGGGGGGGGGSGRIESRSGDSAREARVNAFLQEMRADRNSIYDRMDPANKVFAATAAGTATAARDFVRVSDKFGTGADVATTPISLLPKSE